MIFRPSPTPPAIPLPSPSSKSTSSPPSEIPAPQFFVIPCALHVRSGPGINYPIIRDLHAGEIITAQNASVPREVWIQIAEEQWCALAYNGFLFLRKTL